MSVVMLNKDKCIGCRRCWDICPMDVFRFDRKKRKAVIAYPQDCQNCGQCYLHCKGHALGFSDETFGYALMAIR